MGRALDDRGTCQSGGFYRGNELESIQAENGTHCQATQSGLSAVDFLIRHTDYYPSSKHPNTFEVYKI
jgi:hypothetical protein